MFTFDLCAGCPQDNLCGNWYEKLFFIFIHLYKPLASVPALFITCTIVLHRDFANLTVKYFNPVAGM